jgi:hypothetical protein
MRLVNQIILETRHTEYHHHHHTISLGELPTVLLGCELMGLTAVSSGGVDVTSWLDVIQTMKDAPPTRARHHVVRRPIELVFRHTWNAHDTQCVSGHLSSLRRQLRLSDKYLWLTHRLMLRLQLVVCVPHMSHRAASPLGLAAAIKQKRGHTLTRRLATCTDAVADVEAQCVTVRQRLADVRCGVRRVAGDDDVVAVAQCGCAVGSTRATVQLCWQRQRLLRRQIAEAQLRAFAAVGAAAT